ncbi:MULTISPECIES: hypothetical protein [Ensifer]|jgi:hypothetical protein|uniref:hypothetical protein n=1 Tax=Ensifer TaxID=106591 RepID=UPI0004BBB529|nr:MULTISPECIES: hypothetical protein [unclassified Ensifer]KQU80478.1 hypothetical protein ASD00_35660 [Ensifer sp. Root31]KQW60746.1 hypothetical protein ASD02_24000 [Ensifer sp. Root1252]KQW75288.1 hypothetical protein ASD03_27845 [Ensifer sp. Root127]KQY66834.1 hypothetical protein ASD52_09255 [Ensifer sp. Root142]KRC57428.1 hypothetical protein ASE32_17830 [Ensifer sp. Root231]KRC99987.1 hypothetical protein ASE47_24585 [Ensifer sp. Root258]MDP9634854.1 hypothetical protein [Ensifer adh
MQAGLPAFGAHAGFPGTPSKETIMAKGQVRSNREVRKPKKDKTVKAAVVTEGSQVKLAGSSFSLGKKDKK